MTTRKNILDTPLEEFNEEQVIYDWNELVSNALARRAELLQQQLRIKRRRLELSATRNFLLPQLDVVGRYRRRGLGDNLYDPKAPIQFGGPGTNTGTNEWQAGIELNVPFGYRRAQGAPGERPSARGARGNVHRPGAGGCGPHRRGSCLRRARGPGAP